jgi:hypothetical protein
MLYKKNKMIYCYDKYYAYAKFVKRMSRSRL